MKKESGGGRIRWREDQVKRRSGGERKSGGERIKRREDQAGKGLSEKGMR